MGNKKTTVTKGTIKVLNRKSAYVWLGCVVRLQHGADSVKNVLLSGSVPVVSWCGCCCRCCCLFLASASLSHLGVKKKRKKENKRSKERLRKKKARTKVNRRRQRKVVSSNTIRGSKTRTLLTSEPSNVPTRTLHSPGPSTHYFTPHALHNTHTQLHLTQWTTASRCE